MGYSVFRSDSSGGAANRRLRGAISTRDCHHQGKNCWWVCAFSGGGDAAYNVRKPRRGNNRSREKEIDDEAEC